MIKLGHNVTGAQWDWRAKGEISPLCPCPNVSQPHGNGTQWDWDTMGLVHIGRDQSSCPGHNVSQMHGNGTQQNLYKNGHTHTQPYSAPSSLQIIMSNRLNCYKKTLRGTALIVTGICNAGQYRNVTDNECYDCPIGQYQPDSLQTECLPCDRNLTTRQEGSNNVSQCVCECFTQSPMLIITHKHLYLAH